MGRVFLFYGGSSLELVPGDTVVGRDPSCRIRIHAPWVSRRHARFRLERGQLWLSDLGSRNGTRLNGEEIIGSVRVSAGDEVSLGNQRVTLVVHDDDPFEVDTAVVAFQDVAQAPSEVRPTEVTMRVTQDLEHFRPTSSGRERRRHPRHTLELTVRYESEALQVDAVSLNLSASGVFIQTPILDEVGTQCRLTLLSAGASEELCLRGQVRRVVDNPRAEEPLGLGIEFSEPEGGARRWLETTIADSYAARA
jgi:pSer/pThr/pTyr-binding forkhead associated (FHA) protein